MASQEEDWLLYVDESGDFQNYPCSCVIGIAIRERETPAFEAGLRRSIEQCFPLVPWPPHACDLNIAVSRAAACMLSTGEASHERALCEPAVLALNSGRERRALSPFFAAIDDGRWPSYAVLQSADSWLRANFRAAWGRLAQLGDHQRSHFARVISSLTDHYGAEGVFVVGAAQRGDGVDPVADYLSCLESLFERLFGLLRSRGEKRVVRFRVATRHELEPRLVRRIPLNSTRVLEAARAAADFPLAAPAEGERDGLVRVVPLEHITKFDRHVKSGVVIADFLANRLRRVLSQDQGWSAVCKEASGRGGMVPERAPRLVQDAAPLPCIAHDGAAREWLDQVLRTGVATELDPTRPRWAREQAEAWAGLEEAG